MKKLTILTDMDDVLENFCEEWVRTLNERFGTDVKHSEITEWYIAKFFPGVSLPDLYKPLTEADFWERVRPLPDAVKTLKRLIDDGHNVYVVTASHPDTVPLKLNLMLFKYFPFLKYQNVIICNNKQLVNGNFLIDDNIDNLVGGTYKGLLMSAPHNLKCDCESVGITRVNNWKEIYEIISKYSEQ